MHFNLCMKRCWRCVCCVSLLGVCFAIVVVGWMYLRLVDCHSVIVAAADDGCGERSFYDVTFIDCGSHHDEFVSPLS